MVCASRLFQHGQLGELALGAEVGNFLSLKGVPHLEAGIWGVQEKGWHQGSAFFPQAPGVPTTLSLHPLISSPSPGRIGQCAASLPGVSGATSRERGGTPTCNGHGHLHLLGKALL